LKKLEWAVNARSGDKALEVALVGCDREKAMPGGVGQRPYRGLSIPSEKAIFYPVNLDQCTSIPLRTLIPAVVNLLPGSVLRILS
jgi:hypothetical protein